MGLYIQWIVVGVILAAALYRIVRRFFRKKDNDCSCGCGGCSLKDNCSSRKE